MTHHLPPWFKEKARRILRRSTRVRSAAYFLLSLARVATDTSGRNRYACLSAYQDGLDPWGWHTAWGERHLELIASMMTQACPDRPLDRALDFGCGEGWITDRMAHQFREVVAIDLSPVALERARERCADKGNVTFRLWDIQSGKLPGEFDLVSAVSVLEVLLRPAARRRARRRILEMLRPGGHLLVMTTKQSPVVEQAWWCGLLARGATGVDRFLMASGALVRVSSQETESHVVTLYRYAPLL